MDSLDTLDTDRGQNVVAPLFSSSPDRNAQADDHHGSELLAFSTGEDGSIADPRKPQQTAPEGHRDVSVVSSGALSAILASPEEISCGSEDGRLLQPESYELLDISDFEEDVDDYRSDTSSLSFRKPNVMPSMGDTEEPSLIQDCANPCGEDSTETSHEQGILI